MKAALRCRPSGIRVNSDREEVMVRLGGAASPSYVGIFRGLQAHFLRHGIELDWVIYSNYDALVEAFARREIDLAWNAPLAYIKTKRRLQGACQVVAMRDVDVNFTTHFIANADSVIAAVQDLKGKRVALGSRESMQAGLLPYYFLQQLGLDPAHDLALCSFYDERQATPVLMSAMSSSGLAGASMMPVRSAGGPS